MQPAGDHQSIPRAPRQRFGPTDACCRNSVSISPEFNPESANLHLIIRAAEEFDGAVFLIAREVPRANILAPGSMLKGSGRNLSAVNSG